MSRRVLVHVGAPKTGTSYLQAVLFHNRERLLDQGILYAADRPDAHFLAALDLMWLRWGGLEQEALGAWDRLAEQVRAHEGTAIISHEILAHATRQQVERALASLGHGDDGTEVHLVLSTRDLTRQIPAEWQENLKHRSRISYRAFLEQLREPERTGRIASWFWAVQEVPDVLARWAADLPPERVHVITVPRPGQPSDLLWQRFERVFGLEGLDLDLGVERANASLGVPEAALLRRLNQKVVPTLEPADYRPLVRELLAHNTLSRRSSTPRLAIPPDLHPWVCELQEAWVDELRARRYDVVGDLDELACMPPVEEWHDPDAAEEAQVGAAALEAIEVLLAETARSHHEEHRLRVELDETRAALERSYLRPSYRLRERAVRRLERSGAGRAALGAYRLVRGRSSLSA